MHKQTFTIPCKLDGLNEYTAECRGNKYGGGKCKKRNEEIVLAAIHNGRLKPVRDAYWVNFIWYESRRSRDKDNVAFAKKFILDALQRARITKGDDNRYLMGFYDEFIYGKGNGVVVEIVEKENE
jgi:hypothetical protein